MHALPRRLGGTARNTGAYHSRGRPAGRSPAVGSCLSCMQEAPYCDFARTTSDPVVAVLKHFLSEFEQHIDQKVCPAGACEALGKEENKKTEVGEEQEQSSS